MKFLNKLRTNLMIKKSRRKNKDVTYGSELEIYDANIVYTNRYQNYLINIESFLGLKAVKFLSNIVIQFDLNPDTLYCKEFLKFLDMLSIGSIRYTFIKQKGIMLLYVSSNIYDLESLICANIESSNVLIETIVKLLETLPKDGFTRIMIKNIIEEHRFAYSNNYNYDDTPIDILKPYKDFQTAINRYEPAQIAEIIEIDHLEYGLEKYNEKSAIRLSNIVFITHLNLNSRGFKFEAKRKDGYTVFVYCMRIDDFIIDLEASTLFNNENQGLYANLLSIIFDQNINNYFNINKEKDGVNIFNITPINMERVDNYRDYMENDEDSEEDESLEEVNDYEYSEFYDDVDEVLSEEEIKEAEEYTKKINSKDIIKSKM